MPLEVLVPDLILERLAELSIPDDHEARVGHLAHRNRRGVDQVVLAFVRHQRRNIADDGHLHRQVERGTNVGRRQPLDALHVNAFVDDGDFGSRNPVGDETIADDLAVGDEAVHLRVRPPRERRVAHARFEPA